LPLLERVRVEVYIPDLPAAAYRNLLLSFEEEFTHVFGSLRSSRSRLRLEIERHPRAEGGEEEADVHEWVGRDFGRVEPH